MAIPVATTEVAGITIPSTSPAFLAGVALHILFGLAAVISGAAAMLSRKAPGRHPSCGTIYFWSLGGIFATASALAAVRWDQDATLFILAIVAFAAAIVGRQARQRLWQAWPRVHMTGMGLSYIITLTAFYVDNGRSLPVWRDLPSIAYWLAPSVVGLPILVFNLIKHPMANAGRQPMAR